MTQPLLHHRLRPVHHVGVVVAKGCISLEDRLIVTAMILLNLFPLRVVPPVQFNDQPSVHRSTYPTRSRYTCGCTWIPACRKYVSPRVTARSTMTSDPAKDRHRSAWIRTSARAATGWTLEGGSRSPE